MTIPTWPSNINSKPERDNLSAERTIPAGATTQMEDGPDRVRRRSFTRNYRVPYRIVLETEAEAALARTWIETTLADGTLPFRMPVRLPGMTTFTNRICYIEGGIYKFVLTGAIDVWALTFNLVITSAP